MYREAYSTTELQPRFQYLKSVKVEAERISFENVAHGKKPVNFLKKMMEVQNLLRDSTLHAERHFPHDWVVPY